jgi:hypothetical protein
MRSPTSTNPYFRSLLAAFAAMAFACAGSAPLAAQTARDSTHVTTTKAARDSVARYLKLAGTPGYARRNFALLVKAESVLVASIAPKPDSVPPQPLPGVAKVLIHSNGSALVVGQTLQLLTQVLDATGAELKGVPVALSVDSARLADLSALGVLTGKAPGTVVVTATASGVRGLRAYPIAAAPVQLPPDTIPSTPPITGTGSTAIAARRVSRMTRRIQPRCARYAWPPAQISKRR